MKKITQIFCVSCLLIFCNTVLAAQSDPKQKKSNKTKSSETKQTHAKSQKSPESKQTSTKTTQSSKNKNTTPAKPTVAAKTEPAVTIPTSAPTATSEQILAPTNTTYPAPAAELKPAVVSQSEPPVAPPRVDCFYQIATNPITDIELSLWAQYAALKSFDYSFDKMDTQLQSLKSCFTEQGWTGFNEALKQSGNLTTIKAQQLTVSSQIAGQPEVSQIKTNQWRITVPLDVVYQNTQEKLTQSLAVVLVVTKKNPTELGIVQLIAAPKSEKAAEQAATKS